MTQRIRRLAMIGCLCALLVFPFARAARAQAPAAPADGTAASATGLNPPRPADPDQLERNLARILAARQQIETELRTLHVAQPDASAMEAAAQRPPAESSDA